MNPFELFFEDKFHPRYTALSFKFNKTQSMDILRVVNAILYYANVNREMKENQMYASAGEHILGENEVPHVHVNVCVPDYIHSTNESRRRAKCFEELSEEITGLSCKITQIKDISDIENTMKYPWKEGTSVEIKKDYVGKIPQEVKQYLRESAKALFEASRAEKRKKVRASERSKTLLGQIQEIVGDQSFQNYDEFKKYVALKFFQPLDLEEYPDMSNFRKALEKVAVRNKIVPYHHFI